MKKYLALKDEENFVSIQDGNTLYYGGDQAWYSTEVRRYSACGTVAATNIAVYGGFYSPLKITGELLSPPFSMKQFLFCMNEMYSYIRPLRMPLLSENAPPFKGFLWLTVFAPPSLKAGCVISV